MRGQDLVTGWASEDSEFQDSQVRYRSIWSCPYCTVETRGQAVAGLIPTGSGASAHGQDRGNCGSGSQAGELPVDLAKWSGSNWTVGKDLERVWWPWVKSNWGKEMQNSKCRSEPGLHAG